MHTASRGPSPTYEGAAVGQCLMIIVVEGNDLIPCFDGKSEAGFSDVVGHAAQVCELLAWQ